jgi:serine/threonine protein kinase
MRTAYFSLDSILKRSNCERLVKEYNQGNYIAKGAYGKIYDLCKDTNCEYVLKVMEFNKTMYDNIGAPKEWINEIKSQLKLIKCQQNYYFKFVPCVYDAWFCERKNGDCAFYIVMEKFEGDLRGFIRKFSGNELLKSLIEVKLKILGKALEHINDKCKVCLNDIKLENILYKKNKEGTYDIVFSDFGTSKYNKEATKECINEDIRKFNKSVEEFINDIL